MKISKFKIISFSLLTFAGTLYAGKTTAYKHAATRSSEETRKAALDDAIRTNNWQRWHDLRKNNGLSALRREFETARDEYKESIVQSIIQATPRLTPPIGAITVTLKSEQAHQNRATTASRPMRVIPITVAACGAPTAIPSRNPSLNLSPLFLPDSIRSDGRRFNNPADKGNPHQQRIENKNKILPWIAALTTMGVSAYRLYDALQALPDSLEAPLWKAAERGEREEVQQLIDAGVDVNMKNTQDETVLFRPAYNGHIATVQLLIDAGVNINAQNNRGSTALICAAHNGHLSVVKLLIAAGADVNIKNIEHRTALFNAIFNGHIETVRVLLEAGADFSIQDNWGKTALDAAQAKRHKEIIKLLKAADNKTKNMLSMQMPQPNQL